MDLQRKHQRVVTCILIYLHSSYLYSVGLDYMDGALVEDLRGLMIYTRVLLFPLPDCSHFEHSSPLPILFPDLGHRNQLLFKVCSHISDPELTVGKVYSLRCQEQHIQTLFPPVRKAPDQSRTPGRKSQSRSRSSLVGDLDWPWIESHRNSDGGIPLVDRLSCDFF